MQSGTPGAHAQSGLPGANAVPVKLPAREVPGAQRDGTFPAFERPRSFSSGAGGTHEEAPSTCSHFTASSPSEAPPVSARRIQWSATLADVRGYHCESQLPASLPSYRSAAQSEGKILRPLRATRQAIAARSALRSPPATEADSDPTGSPTEAPEPPANPIPLHVGSRRPHAIDGCSPTDRRVDRWALRGSLRRLEPELSEVLLAEPLPRGNVIKPTAWEDPPPRPSVIPGPFTTAELIPEGVVPSVVSHGSTIRKLLERAERGGEEAWRAARALRPQPLVYDHSEALNPCGRGFSWQQEEGADLWHAILPSSWPEHPPDTSIKTGRLIELADHYGLADRQAISWSAHGFPGAPFEESFAVIGYPHVGALKNAAAFAERNKRDIDEGYVTNGYSFPNIWPTIVDPMNIVVQNGKPRITIDKTMHLSGRDDMPSYNELIDLDKEAATLGSDGNPIGRIKLVRVWQVARACAILQEALLSPAKLAATSIGLSVKLCKIDLKAFYRQLGKQRAAIYQSGRCFTTGYGNDLRVNFGERDAMDHACRHTDGLAFMTKQELKRLDREYPPIEPEIVQWLAMRLGLAPDGRDDELLFAVLFALYFYVDDAVAAILCTPLFDKAGKPVMIIDENGVRRQQMRSELYFTVMVYIPEEIGHECPLDKRFGPRLKLTVFGVDLDILAYSRSLEGLKRTRYVARLRLCRDEGERLPNGLIVAPFEDFSKLVHQLLHASDVEPAGIAHLFHCRRVLKARNSIAHGKSVIIDTKAKEELDWWEMRLSDEDACSVPLASRFNFPGASYETTLVRYTDASREPGKPICESGFGGWCILGLEFLYVAGNWSNHEVDHYSINVLEAKAKDMIGLAFLAYASKIGHVVTHSLAFVDNSTAQHVAERGAANTEGLNYLELQRQSTLSSLGVQEATEHVPGVENDVADWLSRNRVDDALRVARALDLTPTVIELEPEQRSLEGTPYTWA